jgi:hypothetical protein
VLALRDASRANVENNMVAVLAVGGLALVLAAILLFKDWTAKRGTPWRGWVLAGFFTAVLVWLGGLIALAASADWLARNAHYIAAGGLLAGILAVAGANIHRRRERPLAGVLRGDVLRRPPGVYLYTWTAGGMLVAAGVLIVLWLTNVISLFWVEILVAFLFVIFWIVQTIELELKARRPGRLAPDGQAADLAPRSGVLPVDGLVEGDVTCGRSEAADRPHGRTLSEVMGH